MYKANMTYILHNLKKKQYCNSVQSLKRSYSKNFPTFGVFLWILEAFSISVPLREANLQWKTNEKIPCSWKTDKS